MRVGVKNFVTEFCDWLLMRGGMQAQPLAADELLRIPDPIDIKGSWDVSEFYALLKTYLAALFPAAYPE